MALKGDSQAAELERLRIASRVGSIETISKAQEILRLMSSKCRPGSLGRGDLCRTAIAFDLACRVLACPVPHKTAVKLSGLQSDALYIAALGTAQRLLGLQQRYSCEEIANSVGGKRVGVMATSELKRYKERFLASYPARQVASIDLDGTVYAVSAFYLCAKKLKHPVDKQRLLDLCLVREAEFTAVCRSMLDLCYSTLGVSVSDKPSADRLAQFEKAAAIGKKANTGTPSDPSPAAAAAPCASSSGTSRQPNGGATSSAERRRIPLSSASGRGGLGAPRSHIAHLAMSIQTAARRKRYGGMTVAPLEPGGSNEANDSLHDRTHHAKRPRRPAPLATPTEAAGRTAAAAAPAAARAPQAPRAATVQNPYASRRPAMTPASVDRVGGGGARRTASTGTGGTAGTETGGREAGEGMREEERGRGHEQQPRGEGEYAEWKERVLASMENKIRGESGPSSSPLSGSAGAGPSDREVAGDRAAGTAAEDVPASPGGGGSSRTVPAASLAPVSTAAAKKTKQASLTSFFARSD
eukprot:g13993.t1